MWLRDSSAQVWPYLALARKTSGLRALLEGVIRRQTRCILIDPYANAFMANLNAPPLEWSRDDKTDMKPGVGERKYELDSLCYPIRLAHGYWKNTGGTQPFDAQWRDAMRVVIRRCANSSARRAPGRIIFSGPRRHHGDAGRNRLRKSSEAGRADRVGVSAVGRCLHLSLPCSVESLCSAFAAPACRDGERHRSRHALAQDARRLQTRWKRRFGSMPWLRRTAEGSHLGVRGGRIWRARLLMDDANVPSLLGLPYLEAPRMRLSMLVPELCVECAQSLVLPRHGGRGHWRAARRDRHDLADVADRLRAYQQFGDEEIDGCCRHAEGWSREAGLSTRATSKMTRRNSPAHGLPGPTLSLVS